MVLGAMGSKPLIKGEQSLSFSSGLALGSVELQYCGYSLGLERGGCEVMSLLDTAEDILTRGNEDSVLRWDSK